MVVDSGANLVFNPLVIDHFDGAYPRQFSFGLFDRARVTRPSFWEEHFRTSFGPIARGSREPESGYYLFEQGAVRAHRRSSTWLDERAAAQQIIDTFDEKVRRAGWQDAPHTAREAPPPPPTARATPAGPDPFEVLGVAFDADDETIKQAYKEQMKQNHPDRVAHMSAAIRQVAEAQTKAIQAAYEAIRAMRRGSSR